MAKTVIPLGEGLFSEIGKLLALPKIQKDLAKAKDMLEEDPDLQETMETLQYHYAKLQKTLPEFCKKYPDSKACRNLK